MDITDLLPMPPDLGPPFPRFMGVYWPWVMQPQVETGLPQLPRRFGVPKTEAERVASHYGVSESEYLAHPESYPLPVRGMGFNAATYNNAETTEIEWNQDGLPVKITRHRRAVRE